MSDRSATDSRVPGLADFRRRIGAGVLFVSPVGGRIERGVIVGVDHRMVYVDYGYTNPLEPGLGNAIATHPSNLRFDKTAPRQVVDRGHTFPVFSDASR